MIPGLGRSAEEGIGYPLQCSWASPVAQLVKNLPAMRETWVGRPQFTAWVGKIPWRRERLPTPVFWPGEFHGLYSPWVTKSQTRLSNFHFHFTLYQEELMYYQKGRDANRVSAITTKLCRHNTFKRRLKRAPGL